jgi:hypothetical protein
MDPSHRVFHREYLRLCGRVLASSLGCQYRPRPGKVLEIIKGNIRVITGFIHSTTSSEDAGKDSAEGAQVSGGKIIDGRISQPWKNSAT